MRNTAKKMGAMAALLICAIAFSGLSKYRSKDFSDQAWQAKLRSVCLYDSWCFMLTDFGGNWHRPSEEVFETLGNLKPVIHKAAELYNVSPLLIAAIIVTEHSIDIGLKDIAADEALRLRIFPAEEFMRRNVSLGFGQITIPTALMVEDVAAKTEGRSVRSLEEIAQSLLDPAKTIFYVAAICRHHQDVYASFGLKISNNLPIMATLYNLGESELRAKETLAKKRQPRVNFYGLFVERYLPELKKAFGTI